MKIMFEILPDFGVPWCPSFGVKYTFGWRWAPYYRTVDEAAAVSSGC
jgi:hypothetical protein